MYYSPYDAARSLPSRNGTCSSAYFRRRNVVRHYHAGKCNRSMALFLIRRINRQEVTRIAYPTFIETQEHTS